MTATMVSARRAAKNRSFGPWLERNLFTRRRCMLGVIGSALPRGLTISTPQCAAAVTQRSRVGSTGTSARRRALGGTSYHVNEAAVDTQITMTETIDRLEIKITYLEQANAELSEVVYRQGKEIEALHAKLAELRARFEAAQEPPEPSAPSVERPPHY